MKTFKEHLTEHSGHFSRQWLDQDTVPSAPHALEALNSLIGQMSEQEYLNPQVGIEKLQSQLGKLNYHFSAPTLDGGDGTYSMPLSYGAGVVDASDTTHNPYGDYTESDGISDHIEGGVSLQIEVSDIGNGKSLMNAQLIRNADAGE